MKAARDLLRGLLRDPAAAAGLLIILLLVAVGILAPLIATHPEAVWDINPRERLLPPSQVYLFGTDKMGADVYSRVLFGARITLTIALVAVGAALVIGVPIGLVCGWRQSWLGEALMRVSDIFLAVPQIVLAIAIAQTLGPSIENVILALSITYWPWFTRLVHAEVRSLKNETFIEAAIARDASLAHHSRSRAAERDVPDHCAHLDRNGLHHPHRQRARLARPRRAAAGPGMGPHDLGIASPPDAWWSTRSRRGLRSFWS